MVNTTLVSWSVGYWDRQTDKAHRKGRRLTMLNSCADGLDGAWREKKVALHHVILVLLHENAICVNFEV